MDEIEDLIDSADINVSIKKVYCVSLTLTVKGSEDTKDYYTTIYVFKENGKWKVTTYNL
jgi:hypothetical protein